MLQSLVHKTLGTKIGDDVSGSVFVFLKDEVILWCAHIDPATGVFDVYECSGQSVAGVFCYFYEAEVNAIPIVQDSCAVQEEGAKAVVSFTARPLIIGSLVQREITCDGFDSWGESLSGKLRQFTVSQGDTIHYSIEVRIDEELVEINCYCGRRKNDRIYTPTTGVLNLPLNLNSDIVITSPPLYSGIAYFLESDFGGPYEIVVETSGYLIGRFGYRFQPASGEWSRKFEDEDAISTSKEYVCSGFNLMVKATGKKPFSYLAPTDSGLYWFSITAGGEDKELITEFVHPFGIHCGTTCVDNVMPGSSVRVWCTIKHHLLVASEHFEVEPESQPFNLRFWKSEYHSDIPDYKRLNPCEYKNQVETPLVYSPILGDLFTFSIFLRTANVSFNLYSAQEWNVGTYYLEVSTANKSLCYYFGPSKIGTDCTGRIIPVTFDDVNSCSRDSNEQFKLFRITLNQNVGRVYLPEESYSNNSRALYLGDGAPYLDNNDYRYFYKIVMHASDARPEEVCASEGGEYVVNGFDPVINSIIDDDDGKAVAYQNFDLNLFWLALTCNAYLHYTANPQPSDPKSIFFTVRKKEIVYESKTVQFFSGQFFKDPDTDDGPKGALCKFRRGVLWNLYQAPTECMYRPLDLKIGMKQTIYPVIHGEIGVDIECQALPHGSYINQSYSDVMPLSFVEYSIPYPEERDVNAFRCIQKTSGGLRYQPVNWFDFTFNSLPVELITDAEIEPLDYWCWDGNVTMKQPCYGRNVALRACLEANPFGSCNWVRLHAFDSDSPLVQGEKGITWYDELDENPQCTTTRRCFYINFSPLDAFKHNGMYYLNCSDGLEGTVAETTLRRQTRFFKITGHQSGPVGDYSFNYAVICGEERGQVVGRISMYGSNIVATVSCTGSGNENIIAETIPYDTGVSLVQFELPNADKDVECIMTSTNSFAPENPFVLADSVKNHQIWSRLEIVETDRNADTVSICCEACALNVNPRNVELVCYKLSDNLMILYNHNTTYEYDDTKYVAKRCVEVPREFGDAKCRCKLFNSVRSTFTIYKNGDVEMVTDTPDAFEVMAQPANISDSYVTLKPDQDSDIPATTTRDPNLNNNEPVLSPDDRFINIYLNNILGVSLYGEAIEDGMLKATFLGINRLIGDELTEERAVEILAMFKQIPNVA